MTSDDLAGLLAQPPPRFDQYGQGRVLSYNHDDHSNVVEWRGVILRNLPVLRSATMFGLRSGQTVLLGGMHGRGHSGVTQWFILDRLLGQGGSEDSTDVLINTLAARTISVGELNADSITVDGKSLAAFITDLIEDEDPGPLPPGELKRTYTASWSANYRGNGARNEFDERPHQGYFSGTNGNQRSLIGFPTSEIQADHAGRTITRVRVYLYFAHWYQNSGGTAVIGHHGHTSAPSSFSASTDVVRSSGWPKPGSRWVTYDHSMQQWATGAKTGISLGPGPSTSSVYYGRARGAGESSAPRLEIVSNPDPPP